jgi:thioredoxin 1
MNPASDKEGQNGASGGVRPGAIGLLRRWLGGTPNADAAEPPSALAPGARGRSTVLSGLSTTQFIDRNDRVVLDLWAGWCRPCRTFSPIVEDVAKRFVDRVAFGKVNIERDPSLAERWKVASVPTLLFFRNGRLVGRLTGVRPLETLEREVRRILKVGPEA